MKSYNLTFGLLPKCENPHQREAKLLTPDAPFLVVGPRSPLSWRKAIDKIAIYFKREMQFESFLYSCREADDFETQMDRVLVFHNTQIVDRKPTPRNKKDFTEYYVFFGAIGIRRRITHNTAHWALTWAWLHPYERRQGRLAEAWPSILRMFPNLEPEEPCSLAMNAFLKKAHYTFDKGKSESLIFDLAYWHFIGQQRNFNFPTAKAQNREAMVPPMDTTIRLHPVDYSLARKQLFERSAEILSDQNDGEIRFVYWIDWKLVSDTETKPILTASSY